MTSSEPRELIGGEKVTWYRNYDFSHRDSRDILVSDNKGEDESESRVLREAEGEKKAKGK